MTGKTHLHASDVRGVSRLTIEATLGITDLVEAMHSTIVHTPGILSPWMPTPTRGLTGLVYRSIRGITRLVGGSLDLLLAPLIPLLGEPDSSPEREAVLAALNGICGDTLAASDNPLTISMRLRREGQPLELTQSGLARALPHITGKILVLVHGLCLNDLQWRWQGHDHGASLAADLGYTPVYLHYNTGLHISINGRTFAELLEALLQQWPMPVTELVIVAHSMGGLVSRSACLFGMTAGHAWLKQLRKIVFLGTPHQGAPLERGGQWVQSVLGVSPYTAVFTRLGKIRSAGITDLRYGNVRDEEWDERDRFAPARVPRQATPLPKGVQCYTVGVITGKSERDLRGKLLGDGLVPLRSALGEHPEARLALRFPKSHQWIGYGMHHLDLLHRREVYEQIRKWLTA